MHFSLTQKYVTLFYKSLYKNLLSIQFLNVKVIKRIRKEYMQQKNCILFQVMKKIVPVTFYQNFL